ncbi:hypothetical protein SNEBB_004209 [Seison nebaliae]|nr:hypothetical protein SNEBB_004209 [Seison nebaliae]
MTSVLQYWQENLNLKTLLNKLEEEAHLIAKNQDDAVISREDLVKQCRDIRSMLKDDVQRVLGPLVVRFQKEIDILTKRSIYAESCYMNIFKVLLEAPDPIPSIQLSVKYSDLERENIGLKETLNEYKKEFADVTNQQITLKSQREKIKDLEEKLEKEQKHRQKEKEMENKKDYELRLKENEKILNELNAKLMISEDKQKLYKEELENLQRSIYESNQSHFAQLNLLKEDVDRLNNDKLKLEEKLKISENCEIIKKEKEFSEEIKINDNESSKKELEEKMRKFEKLIEEKNRENFQLVSDINQLNHTHQSQRLRWQMELERSKNVEENLVKEKEELIRKLSDYSNYDEMRNELEVFHSAEFGNMKMEKILDDDDDDDVLNDMKKLNKNLLKKIRLIQNDITTERKLRINAEKELIVSKKSLEKNEVFLKEKINLIKRLEDDLSQFSHRYHNSTGEYESFEGKMLNDVLTKEEVFEDKESENEMMGIVVSQRDRLQRKCEVLENDNESKIHMITVLNDENGKLKSYNLKLYEQLQFYKERKFDGTIQSKVVDEYQVQYEKNLNPFNRFQQTERIRRYEKLNILDKIALGLTQLLSTSSLIRVGFVVYFIVLHLLICLSLYRMAHVESRSHDMAIKCEMDFQKHMNSFHGNH